MINNRLRKAGAVRDGLDRLVLEIWDRDEAHKVKSAIVLADINSNGDILGYYEDYYNIDQIMVDKDFISVYVTSRTNGGWADINGEELPLCTWDGIFQQLDD